MKIDKKLIMPALKLPSYSEVVEAGCTFGHNSKEINSHYKAYVSEIINKAVVIDANKTIELMEKALLGLQEVIKEKGIILWVSEGENFKNLTISCAKETNSFYICNPPSGLLTNFNTIKSFLFRLNNTLDKDYSSSQMRKNFFDRNSRDRHNFSRNQFNSYNSVLHCSPKTLEKSKEKYAGIMKMQKLPDLIIFLGFSKLVESDLKKLNNSIKTISVVDSNQNPNYFSYPIPSNAASLRTMEFISRILVETAKDVQNLFL